MSRGTVDISGEDWEKINWEELDFQTLDWSKLSPEQKGKLRKISKKEKKRRKKAEKELKRKKREEEEREKREAKQRVKISWEERFEGSKSFGDLPVMMSEYEQKIKIIPLKYLNPALKGEKHIVRARIHTLRKQGRMIFVVLRDGFHTVQVVISESEHVSKDFVRYVELIPRESIVDVHGEIVTVEKPTNTTQKDVEILVSHFYCYSSSRAQCPLLVEDAMKSDVDLQRLLEQEREQPQQKKKKTVVLTGQDVRLDYRYLDLRAPAHKAIFRICSGVGMLFREYLHKEGFTEIHSPKIISTASEGGCDVFTLDYFSRKAFLAQSPQLYKQMAIMCDFDRVMEVGPVFRAENSNTNRHLTEFTGLDIEMKIKDHYHEVLNVLNGVFVYIFEGLRTRYKDEVEEVRKQYPFEDMTYETEKHNLVINFQEGMKMLRESGYQVGDYDDLDTEGEKRLGKLVKEKYGTDFYILDKYPMAVRPFYTMPCPKDERYSNSYDLFIRGQEVTSGAQRIHDPNFLLEKAKEKEVDLTPIMDYVNSFGYGAWPHGGAGIGLERVVMLYLGLPNIRKATLFPRDPKRLNP